MSSSNTVRVVVIKLEFIAHQVSKLSLDCCSALPAAESLMLATHEVRMKAPMHLMEEKSLPEYKFKPNLRLICRALDSSKPLPAAESLWHEAGQMAMETFAYASRHSALGA